MAGSEGLAEVLQGVTGLGVILGGVGVGWWGDIAQTPACQSKLRVVNVYVCVMCA